MKEMELYFWFQNLGIKISIVITIIYLIIVVGVSLYYLIKDIIKEKIERWKKKCK